MELLVSGERFMMASRQRAHWQRNPRIQVVNGRLLKEISWEASFARMCPRRRCLHVVLAETNVG